MDEFPVNSRKSKDEGTGKKIVEKVVTGEVVKQKPPLGHRMKTMLFGGDARSVTAYVIADILVPAVRNMIVDTISRGAERAVYGETRPRTRGPGIFPMSRVQYHSPVARGPLSPARLPDQNIQPKTSSNLILATRDEAELVLERMGDILDNYEVVTMADLCDLTGLPQAAIDNKWGWTNLNTATVKQVRDGFLLDLPNPEEL